MKSLRVRCAVLVLVTIAGCVEKPDPWTPWGSDAEVNDGDQMVADGKGEIGVNPADGKGEVPVSLDVLDVAGDNVVAPDVSNVADVAGPDTGDAPNPMDLLDSPDAVETKDLPGLDVEVPLDVPVDAEVAVEIDVPCIPGCEDKVCGDNDGCAGMCTGCPGEQELCVLGKCECIPACEGKECGPDGCDGSCGDCGGNQECSTAGLCACVAEVVVCGDACCAPGEVCHAGQCCLPDCTGKECGSDGCGGTCGECDDGNPCTQQYCVEGGTCAHPSKQDGTECEVVGICVGKCQDGACSESAVEDCDGLDNNCNDQVDEGFPNYDSDDQADCVDPDDDNDGLFDDVDCEPQNETIPSCAGKECGDDGCAGSCGTCADGESCQAGQCQVVCGDDQCGLGEDQCNCPGDCAGGCAGCCSGVDCLSGDTLIHCGSNGVVCDECTGGKVCEAGECACTVQDHKECADGDVYWFDSCGVQEEKDGDCGEHVCSDGACQPAACPDGFCNGDETKCTCAQDCGACAGCCSGGECQAGTAPAACGVEGAACQDCMAQAQSCVDQQCQVFCGDDQCSVGEDQCNCPVDCGNPCSGKECGSDGCGGSCGACGNCLGCLDGQCVSACPTWTDPTSGLTWQNPPSAGELMIWQQASGYCSTLGLDGGGWHLPTVGELRSLIRGCPATEAGGSCNVQEGVCLAWSCQNGLCGGCSSDNGPAGGCYWPDEMQGQGECSWYWSSSPYETDGGYAWAVRFGAGLVDPPIVSYPAHVRCVRDAP